MNIPIIFIHRGYSDYMEYSLRQARAVCPPETEIYLLGDEKNKQFDFIKHVDISQYRDTLERFGKIYRHLSTNSPEYESFCLARWLILERFFKDYGITAAFVVDTDILIFEDLNYLLPLFQQGNFDFAAVRIDNTQFYTISQSLITQTILESFSDFIQNLYSNPGALEQHTHIFFPVCDMTVFTEYLRQHQDLHCLNILDIYDDKTTDAGINNADGRIFGEYKLSWTRQKKIKWKKNIPFAYNQIRKKWIQMSLLHYQGFAKYRMAWDYRGGVFAGKNYLDLKFFMANIAAWLYGQLISPLRFRVKKFFCSKKNNFHGEC